MADTRAVAMDLAIARLSGALRAADLPDLRPTRYVIGPEQDAWFLPVFRLPSDLRRFWETVDPSSVPLACESLRDIFDASQIWSDSVGLACPPSLLAVCALGSHHYMYVELDDTKPRGGCFEGGTGARMYTLQLRSFTQWVELIAVAVESGEYEEVGGNDVGRVPRSGVSTGSVPDR